MPFFQFWEVFLKSALDFETENGGSTILNSLKNVKCGCIINKIEALRIVSKKTFSSRLPE
jgi:hypothetical protein